MKNKNILNLVLLLISSMSMAGPVGSRFSYQGELLENGTPVTGIYTFAITLYNSPDSVIALSNDAVIGVNVIDGQFSLEFDVGDADFTGDEVWMNLYVREQGLPVYTNLLPRQRINAVPYAIQSEFGGDGSSQWQNITGGIGYSNNVIVGNLGTTTSSILSVDASNGQSPLRIKIDGSTKMIITSNGGTSIGTNTSAPDNGLRVEGITRLFGNTELKNDLKQDIGFSGALKAGLAVTCSPSSSIGRSFNGVNDQAFTINTTVATGTGTCGIDFPFSLSDRYFVAMVQSSLVSGNRNVACSDTNGGTTLVCSVVNFDNTLTNAVIQVLVY